jgi:ABC-type cobalamin/Fe3+-siderophores transport system ATPase subunit
MIVTVGGEKGGSGKTTLAATLAAYHAVMGNDVLLVNADPQQSASYWSEQRRFYHPDAKEIVCVSVRGGKIYSVHLRTRKSPGGMMRKLSVTLSQSVLHLLSTSLRRKPSTVSQNSLHTAIP